MGNSTIHPRKIPWIIPSVYIVGALAAGLTIPRFETQITGNFSPMSTSAAIAIYSAVASGMMALTGIVFSLTFLMVQFSGSAYSPRLIGLLSRDPVTGHALGAFTATFLYAVSAVAGVDRQGSGKVPILSVLILLALLLLSVGLFVALIQRIGSVQLHRVLKFTGDCGRGVVEALYSSNRASAPPRRQASQIEGAPIREILYEGDPKVVQSLRLSELVSLAQSTDTIIAIEVAVGETVVNGMPLARVYGRTAPNERSLRNAIAFGPERTFDQDPLYAIRLLVDIAIRALSPAINDPTTATQALDQIEDLLIRIGANNLDLQNWADAEGVIRVIARFPTWEDFLLLALDEIRSCGATSVQIMRRMNALILNLQAILPDGRQEALRHWSERIQRTVEQAFHDPTDIANASISDRFGLGIPSRQRNPLNDRAI